MLLVPVVARGVTVEPVPQSEYADTEVSTEMGEVVLVEGKRPGFAVEVR